MWRRLSVLLLAQLVGADHVICSWNIVVDSNSCASAVDGECDDGGPGAEFDVCTLGTDAVDCGSRSGRRLSEPARPKPTFMNAISTTGRVSNSRELEESGDYTSGATCLERNMYTGSCGFTWKKTKCWEGGVCCVDDEDACCIEDMQMRIGIVVGAGVGLLLCCV